MFIYEGIERDPLLHVCITEPLRLGHADILRETPRGILVYDRPGKLLLLSAADMESAAELLDGMEAQRSVDFIMLCDAAFSPLIERFDLEHSMICRQAAYFRAEPPAPDPRLTIEAPDERAFARILQSYHMDSPAELRRRADAGELFFARTSDGADMGFVGLHPEGCFGLLEVFPEQRGKGYGAALEAHILRFCLETGRVPYCQVEEENLVSFNLQKKLGLEISDKPMRMAWRGWD